MERWWVRSPGSVVVVGDFVDFVDFRLPMNDLTSWGEVTQFYSFFIKKQCKP